MSERNAQGARHSRDMPFHWVVGGNGFYRGLFQNVIRVRSH